MCRHASLSVVWLQTAEHSLAYLVRRRNSAASMKRLSRHSAIGSHRLRIRARLQSPPVLVRSRFNLGLITKRSIRLCLATSGCAQY